MTNKRLAKKALAILNKKSEGALQRAKELILKERFRCEKAKEALKYYVSTWNDTTRPGVLALAHEAVGGKPREVIPLQIAMLFIDAAMDIHDDIIDKSAVKGSKETLYGKFGEETALLIGNAFLVKGFNYLYKIAEKLPLEEKQPLINAVKNFLFKVIDAHLRELELRDKKWYAKPEEYLNILKAKAADIEGHMHVGAIFGGGSLQEIRVLTKYGKCLGILLLTRSDFIDMFERDELVSRVKYECLPLPVLYALQNTTYRNKIYEILSDEEINEKDIEELIETIYKTSEISIVKRYLERLEKIAISLLNNLQSKKIKDTLSLLARSMLEDL